MFAPIFVILVLLLSFITLPNGIRIIQIPDESDSFEVLAGYKIGGLNALSTTTAARSLALAAYATGGEMGFFDDLDRSGFRMTVPGWARQMVLDELPAFFKEVPHEDHAAPANTDFRSKVEEEIRTALIGSRSEAQEFATDRAFVAMSGAMPESSRASLAAIPKRASTEQTEATITRLPAERTLRFTSDLPAGAVIFASPVPSVYYKQWYTVLLLDRLIERVVPLSLTTALPLSVHPYYYRMEAPVPAGKFPEPIEENLLQEIQRLQFTRADSRDLEAARQDARAYLESRYVRQWFLSHDIPERREEGIQWVQSMTADEMRIAARDLLIMNRVIATWAPKVKQTPVSVENLGEDARPSPGLAGRPLPGGEVETVRLASFPAHKDPALKTVPPERLASGVSIVESNVNAVFVAGGPLTKFNSSPDAEAVTAFQTYRADRILVLGTPDSLDRARQLWSSFKGASAGEAGVAKGDVTSTDLPALLILTVLLDRKLIEAGWWRDVQLNIDASVGSTLQIRSGDDTRRARVIEWIKRIAAEKPSDSDFAWAREVAIHRFDTVRPDLQALIWERDPQGTIIDLETITAAHVQDVARIYFN